MLQIHHLIQRRMQIRTSPPPHIRPPLQQSHLSPILCQRHRRRQPSRTRAHYEYIAHPSTRFHAAITIPCARIKSFAAVDTLTRRENTSPFAASIRFSNP